MKLYKRDRRVGEGEKSESERLTTGKVKRREESRKQKETPKNREKQRETEPKRKGETEEERKKDTSMRR